MIHTVFKTNTVFSAQAIHWAVRRCAGPGRVELFFPGIDSTASDDFAYHVTVKGDNVEEVVQLCLRAYSLIRDPSDATAFRNGLPAVFPEGFPR